MQLITDNPNPLSLTFNASGLIDMGPFRKVVIPKGHDIGGHVPIAKILLEQNDAFDRVELTSDDGDNTTMTLCLSPNLKAGNPDFKLNDAQKGQISSLVSQIHQHLIDTKQNPFHIGCISNGYSAEETLTSARLSGEIRQVFDVATSILTPMAAKDGGSYEVVDIYDVSGAPLSDIENRYLDTNKQSIGFDIVVFGSCSGCSAFNLTYGLKAKEIAPVLREQYPECAMQLRQITLSDKYGEGKALIFK